MHMRLGDLEYVRGYLRTYVHHILSADVGSTPNELAKTFGHARQHEADFYLYVWFSMDSAG
jgi:hypothetical protein